MKSEFDAPAGAGRTCSGRPQRLPLVAVLAAGTALLGGCLGTVKVEQRHGYGSAMDFLYPPTQDGQLAYKTPELPATIRLPMRIGLAFAPDIGSYSAMPDPTQDAVLDGIGQKLSSYPFVQSVVVIPHVYLQRGGGFANLRQLRAAFGVDVVGLVSFDQIANTTENPASILYLTLVGRYFIPGDKHEVKTLLDVLLLEPQSETLLMRAAGTSSLKGLSPDAFAGARASELSRQGYERAVPPLLAELEERLEELKEDVRSGRRKDVKVEVKAGHSTASMGLGAGGPLEFMGLLLLLGAMSLSTRRGPRP